MPQPLPFMFIPQSAQLLVITNLDQDSFPIIQLRKYFPGRDFVTISTRDFKILNWKNREKNYHGFIYLEESKDQLLTKLPHSENSTPLGEDSFRIQSNKWQGIPVLMLLGGGRPGLIYAVNELGQKILSLISTCYH